MSYLDQVTKYLASNDPLNLPDISSDYRTAMEQMFDDLGSISAGLSRLSVETASYSAQIISDMKAVNDQFNVVMMRLCDILELALSKDKDDIIQDISEEELASTTDGKVYNCDNYGKVDGDVNVGGVAGTMGIEYDYDPESDSNIIKDATLTAKYFTKCVLVDSRNYGNATSRKTASARSAVMPISASSAAVRATARPRARQAIMSAVSSACRRAPCATALPSAG